jgi:hypothetical protein
MNFDPVDPIDLVNIQLYRMTEIHLDFLREYQKSETADFTKLFLIPFILATQPSQDWIEKMDTPDRVRYWAEFSRRFYWIAKCWITKNTFQKDPLRPLLNEGRISRNTYNIIWFAQKMFERLWDICQHTAPFVQKAFEQVEAEHPFPDEISLFAQIVEEMVNSEFSLCLERYAHFSRTKREKALRLRVKAYAGKQLTKTQERIIKSQRQKTYLGDLVLSIAKEAAKEEAVIKAALEDYEIACGRLLKAYATEWHNKGCHSWIHGRIVKPNP